MVSLRWRFILNTGILSYSYWSGISVQKQPANSSINPIWIYSGIKHIASDIVKYTWSLSIANPVTTINTAVTGMSNSVYINRYSIFGQDLLNPIVWVLINTSTGITFANASASIKNIITQIYSGNNFATHFVKSVQLDLMSGLIIWNPWNLSFGTVTAGSTWIANFIDYFWIQDGRWYITGHYTTIQCAGLYGPSNLLITGVQMSGSLSLINGVSNANVKMDTGWIDITDPQLYFYKTNNSNNTGKMNKYGSKPSIRVYIPSWSPAGSYSGKVIYTLYDQGL